MNQENTHHKNVQIQRNPISPLENKRMRASGMAGDENQENKDDKNENQGIENQNEQENEEYRNQNHPTAPSAPTKEEWIEHQITHVPFRP